MARMLLVLMELGSSFPTCVEELQEKTPDSIVIVQQPMESPAGLVIRLAQRLLLLEGEGHGVVAAVVAVGRADDEQSHAARQLVASALLSHMAALDCDGTLVLAGEGAAECRRGELMVLADEMMGRLVGTQLSIDVQFNRVDEAGAVPSSRRAGAGQALEMA